MPGSSNFMRPVDSALVLDRQLHFRFPAGRRPDAGDDFNLSEPEVDVSASRKVTPAATVPGIPLPDKHHEPPLKTQRQFNRTQQIIQRQN